MPTYEYACGACGHEWEKEQRISDSPLRKCPKCGKSKAQRLISGGNFILKGDGWYADLYHKPAKPKAAPVESSSSSESKPEPAKTEKKAKKKKASGA
ncbi:MAG: zinc ribbon domain-containing protein [Sandaracinaceae bacterium]